MKLRHPERRRGIPMRKFKDIIAGFLDYAWDDGVVVLADSDWSF